MKEQNKGLRIARNSIYILLTALIVVLLTLDLCFSGIDYSLKKDFLLPNIALVAIFISIIAIVAYCFSKREGKGFNKLDNHIGIKYAALLFGVGMLYISYNIYFWTGWDVRNVIRAAKVLAAGGTIDASYFAQFPNQQLLLIIETILFKINNNFGVIDRSGSEFVTDSSDGLMMLIAIQCCLYTITGYLIYKIVYDYTHSKRYSWLAWIMYCMLLGVTGWMTIPYTDGMALIFPVLILRVYQNKGKYKGKLSGVISWIMISFLSYWGYKMKPTVVIMLIAILIAEVLFYEKRNIADSLKKSGQIVVIILSCFIISSGLFKAMIGVSGIEINNELNTGVLHMVMVGLNDESDGAWNEDDVEISFSAYPRCERHNVQVKEIKDRLQAYGVGGFIKHIARKSLVVFNDGTFAWGEEGGFYKEIYDEKNSFVSPLLRSIFYNRGDKYPLLSTMEQGLWLVTLFLCCFCLMAKKDKIVTTVVTSLVGIILFNYIFEARARYILIYVPVIIILAVMSLERIVKKMNRSVNCEHNENILGVNGLDKDKN